MMKKGGRKTWKTERGERKNMKKGENQHINEKRRRKTKKKRI